MASSLNAKLFTALAPLVGARVYPLVAPGGVSRPYVVLTPVSLGASSYTLRRTGGTDRRSVQVDVYADSFDDGEAAAHAVRRRLESEGGRVTGAGAERETDTGLYRQRLDFDFWHRPG